MYTADHEKAPIDFNCLFTKFHKISYHITLLKLPRVPTLNIKYNIDLSPYHVSISSTKLYYQNKPEYWLICRTSKNLHFSFFHTDWHIYDALNFITEGNSQLRSAHSNNVWQENSRPTPLLPQLNNKQWKIFPNIHPALTKNKMKFKNVLRKPASKSLITKIFCCA